MQCAFAAPASAISGYARDDSLASAAMHGAPASFADYLVTNRYSVQSQRPRLGQLPQTKQTFSSHRCSGGSPLNGDKLREATIKLAGARNLVGVPMLKDNEVIGAIVIYRREVRPFTDKQIELLTELRRASRHRDREHAAAQRAARIAAAADRDRRRAQGHQPIDV